ncbi:MAG: META domain-containing protein [Chitinophagaceae bacterium]
MKSLFIALMPVAIILCFFATGNAKNSNKINYYFIDSSIEGSWQLQPVLASDTAAGRIPTLNFNLSDRRFSGNTGCNSMSGHFVLKGDSLAFSEQIITTKMACPGYNEKAFIENLTRTNHYKIENGVLELLTDKSVLSKWIRKGAVKDTLRKV